MNRNKNFYILFALMGSVFTIISVTINQFGVHKITTNLQESFQALITDALSGSLDLATAQQSIMDLTSNADRANYMLTAGVLILFAIMSYGLIISLVKLTLKNTNAFSTYSKTIAQTVSGKQITNTIKFFALIVISIAAVIFFTSLAFDPIATKVTGLFKNVDFQTASQAQLFLYTTTIEILSMIFTALLLFVITLVFYISLRGFFKIEYKQNLKTKTLVRRSLKATIEIILVFFLVYLFFYIPNVWASKSETTTTQTLISIVVFYIQYMSAIYVISRRFTGKQMNKNTNDKVNTQTQSTSNELETEILNHIDVVTPRPSRSRLTGFTKNHEIRGSRIERSRRTRR